MSQGSEVISWLIIGATRWPPAGRRPSQTNGTERAAEKCEPFYDENPSSVAVNLNGDVSTGRRALVPVCAEIEMTEADFCCGSSTEEIDFIGTV